MPHTQAHSPCPSIIQPTISSLLHSSTLTLPHHLILYSMHLFAFSVFVSMSNSLSTSSKTYCFSACYSFSVSRCLVVFCSGFCSLFSSIALPLHLFYQPLYCLPICAVSLTHFSFALRCHFYLFFYCLISAQQSQQVPTVRLPLEVYLFVLFFQNVLSISIVIPL